MNRYTRFAPKCILGVSVVAMFFLMTWATTVAHLSTTSTGTTMQPSTGRTSSVVNRISRPVFATTAVVMTDKPDYSPGETVVITGWGWQPGETVNLRIDESDGDAPWLSSAQADSTGNISNSQFVIQTHDLGVVFTLTANGVSSGLTASTTFTDNLGTDFSQGSNTNPTQGNVVWINSILQQNNSTFFEGQSTLQRVFLVDIPKNSAGTYTLHLSHQATKGTIHAYDFIDNWPTAVSTSNAIAANTYVNLNNCANLGPKVSSALCANLDGATGVFLAVATPPAAADYGTTASNGDNVGTRVATFDTANGGALAARGVTVQSDAPVSGATLVFDGYDTGSDQFAFYSLNWNGPTGNSNQTYSVLIKLAGHIAVSGNGTGIGYGVGKGAASINGGPYHFKLSDVVSGTNVISLGSQDNQLKGSDIFLPPPSCNVDGPGTVCGGSTNTYTAQTDGVDPTFSWTISGGGGSIVGSTTGQSVQVLAGSSGTYTVSVTITISSGGKTASSTCTKTATVTSVAFTTSSTNVTCNGANNGTITATVTSGTAPFMFELDLGGFVSGTSPYTFNNVAPGTHTVTVKDNNNCMASQQVTITEPAALTCSSSATAISCNGGNSTVTVSASGGTPPYTGTGDFTRTAGTYSFTVTDANGCTCTTSVTITEPAALTCSSSATAISCNGGNSTVTVSASGGTAPYTGTGSFSRTAGTYTFNVTDANGCTCSTTVTITEPAVLTCSSSATPILCNGGSSTVTVSASGGTLPYTGTGSFSRTAGTYSFTVTDANGCTCTTSVTITEPPLLTASSSATPILCNGGSSTVTVSASGGTPPYTGIGDFTRTAGTYSFTVTDANGCTATTSVTITQPPVLMCSSSATPILCNGGNSTVTVSASGGTPPYTGIGDFTRTAGTYSFTVTDANGCSCTTSVTITQPPLLTASSSATPILCNGGSSTVTVSASGGTPPYTGIGDFTRTAGTYSFTVTDANGCTATTSVTITEPTALTCSSSATAISCFGGSSTVTVSASGGTPPYTGIGDFTETAGTHTFTVTDANGCSCTTSVTISQPSALVVSSSATPIACNGGSSTVTVSASGGTPSYSGTGSFTRTAGTYTFNVTDANGCSGSTTITITEPPVLTCGSSATPILCFGDSSIVTVSANGGTPPYTGTGNFTRAAGTYTFEVTDHNGCSCSTTITILQPTALGCSLTPPAQSPLCGSTGNTLTVTASGGVAPYTYLWSVTPSNIGWTITNQNDVGAQSTITYTAGPAGSVVFSVIVKDSLGGTCSSTCTATVRCSPPQIEFCGLTQGFYGNQGGKFGCLPGSDPCVGMTANQLIKLLLDTYGDLTVGKPGQSFTLRQANSASDAGCLVKKLPANSTPYTLPAGDGVFTGGCNTSTNIPTGAGSRWLNVLLGQTITLALNIRYDGYLHGGPPNGLGGLTICSTMVTQASLVGPDGKPGTGDEVIDPGPDNILGNADDPKITVTIPNNVMCALLTIGDHTLTVNNLLELANLALAGQAPAGVTVADVNFAVNSINVGFDRCRFLISCTGGCSSATNLSSPKDESQVVAQNYIPVVSTPFVNRLNLFGWLADTNNLLGKLLTVPVDSEISPGYQRFAGLSGKNVVTHSIRMPANT